MISAKKKKQNSEEGIWNMRDIETSDGLTRQGFTVKEISEKRPERG